MKRTVIISALGLLAYCLAAPAQNLNPTVEVTNAYAREASGIEKPSQLREVPDSVLRFNLDFDYSVMDTPYKGAYEFNPYLIQSRPGVEPSSERSLFLRAGIGYGLHPELTAVWTPVKTRRFCLNVFGDHHSYMGQYHHWAIDGTQWVPDGTSTFGKEMRSSIGADAQLNWDSGTLLTGIGYNHVLGTSFAQGDLSSHRIQMASHVKNIAGTTRVDYDLGTRATLTWAPGGMRETHTVTDGTLGFPLLNHRWALGMQAETVSQPGGSAASFQFTLPGYHFTWRGFDFVASVKAAFVARSDAAFVPGSEGYVFPDVRASWMAVPEKLLVYGLLTGGNQLVSYDSLLDGNPFVAGFDWYTDVQVQRLLLVAGLRGQFDGGFHYDVQVGYSHKDNLALWGTNAAGAQALCYAAPVYVFHVQPEVGWRNGCLDVGGRLRLSKILNTPKVAAGLTPFEPPVVTGDAHVKYNWGERFRLELSLDGRSRMSSPVAALPGYVDIGLEGSFQMNRELGLWLKIGNLAGQPVQRVPFYAQKGPYFTVGASWVY